MGQSWGGRRMPSCSFWPTSCPASAFALRLGWRLAPFWSGVCALGWFSHGVMSAWSHPETARLAWVEILLSLLVIALASLPGLRARFGRRGR